jgi:hypothetical protein
MMSHHAKVDQDSIDGNFERCLKLHTVKDVQSALVLGSAQHSCPPCAAARRTSGCGVAIHSRQLRRGKCGLEHQWGARWEDSPPPKQQLYPWQPAGKSRSTAVCASTKRHPHRDRVRQSEIRRHCWHLLSGTGRSRPRWPAPLVEPGAVFAHLLALRRRRVALAG